jgi:hypothetical protein
LPEFTRLTSTKRSSEVIRGHPRSSEVLGGYQRISEDIRGYQRISEDIRGHQLTRPPGAEIAIRMQSACNQLTRPTSGKMPPDAEIAFSRSPSKISHTPLTPSLVSSMPFESLPVQRKEFAEVSTVSAVPVNGGEAPL